MRTTSPAIAFLRRRATGATLFAPTTLGRAVARLGFVQADPIRAPARAQDLILRHRVADYRAGDLERRFARLGLEEDYLYAYGFLPRTSADLLHPRHDPDSPDGRHRPQGLAAEVFEFVAARGRAHPQDLMARFGRVQTANAWGGLSQATTKALQHLQHHGLLRVAARRDGIRIYEPAPARADTLAPAERARAVVLLVAAILAPVSPAALVAACRPQLRFVPAFGPIREVVQRLLAAGELARATIDGESYLWPASLRAARSAGDVVRLLAPFDPIVWDRRRFAHLWDWDYRFEAYTPESKRVRGYYALPLLWRDDVIGWANLAVKDGRLDAEIGFQHRAPRERAFTRALDEELARVERFLGLDSGNP